jgi:predicted phosphodiesterase
MIDNIVKQRYNTVIGILQSVVDNQTSITLEEVNAGVSEGYVRKSKKVFSNALEADLITDSDYKRFQELYEEALQVKKLTKAQREEFGEGYDDTGYDKRAYGLPIREDEDDPYSRITGYRYKIYLRDREAIEGTLTREQLEKIYHLYPYVTAHNVSQEFPTLTFIEFKKVLRAFNITKDRLFPPHILEEKSEQEVAILTLKAKERAAGKKLVDVKEKFLEDELKIAREKNAKFEKGEKWVEEVISRLTRKYFSGEEEFDIKSRLNNINENRQNQVVDLEYVARVSRPVRKNTKDTFAFFGDIHFGKVYKPKHNRFGRGTDKKILKDRILKMAEITVKEATMLGSDTINLICLGDLFECLIPENMHVSQKYALDLIEDEQIDYAIDVFIEMLAYILAKEPNIQVNLYGIGGNHDRITKGRDDDRHRVGAKMFFSFLEKLSKAMFGKKVYIEYFKEGLMSFEADGISVITSHGEESIAKKSADTIMNLHKVGDTQNFTVIASGHLHNFSQKPFDEGINYVRFQVSSICSPDDYSVNKLGVGAQPSFALGSRADGYGFDFTKKTLA